MSVTPRVSVVVPYYETGAALAATVRSLLAQTEQRIEILVVDDGSRDHPARAVLAAMLELRGNNTSTWPRVLLDVMPLNLGYAGVTAHAIARCRSPWILFVDADDTVTPDCLERLLAAGDASAADLVVCPLMAVRSGREIGPLPCAPRGLLTPQQAARAMLRGTLVLSQHTLMRSPVPALMPERCTFSDAVQLMDHLARARRVAVLDQPLYRYRIHARSTTGALRESAWDLTRLPELMHPAIAALFPDAELARDVHQDAEDYVTTQLLHKAAREPTPTPLRHQVHRWARRRITVRSVLRHAVRGDAATAASWLLALVGERPHAAAYRIYDRRKDWNGAS